jgi:tRNA threonylcarbamoyladenosine biosynthesis protein TsaB
MRILLIDTCGEMGSVALADTDATMPGAVSTVLPGRSASERLVATVRDLAAQARVQLHELNAIAVVNGPGSFTGVRVGVSAGKGLCEALGIPVVAISRLAVLAESAGIDERVLALLDAGRGEFYCGIYNGETCVREALLSRDQVLEAVAEGGRVIACEARVAEGLTELSPVLVPANLAEIALEIAVRRVASGAFDDTVMLDANYLRRTDAEIFAKQQAARTS